MWEEIQIHIHYTATEGGTVDREHDYLTAVTGKHTNASSAGDRLTSLATAKPGYHFVGWKLCDGCDDEAHGGSVMMRIAGDLNDSYFTVNGDKKINIRAFDGDRLYGAHYIAMFEKNADASITYDPNDPTGEDVTGTVAPTKQTHGLTATISNGSGFKRNHHTLIGWNTEADGSGTFYKKGQEITMPEAGMKLFAMWDINSYDAKVHDRGDHVADVKGGNTKVEWGKPLSPEFIAGISQTPKPGATFKGWKYTMTDADTGEVVTGTVQDLSELIILGPIEIEADYDYVAPEDPVEPELGGTVLPKTGDDLGLIAFVLATIALLAAIIAILSALFRRSEDDEEDPRGNRGVRARARIALGRVMNVGNGRIADLRTAGAYCTGGSTLGARIEEYGYAGAISRTGHHFGEGDVRSFARIKRPAFVATSVVAAVLLSCVVMFSPGFAFASSDGGSGTNKAAHATSTHATTQTHAQATKSDPVTSKAGSSSSSEAARAAARATSSDETKRLTYRNSVAHATNRASGSTGSVKKASSGASSSSASASGDSSQASDRARAAENAYLTCESAENTDQARESATGADVLASQASGISTAVMSSISTTFSTKLAPSNEDAEASNQDENVPGQENDANTSSNGLDLEAVRPSDTDGADWTMLFNDEYDGRGDALPAEPIDPANPADPAEPTDPDKVSQVVDPAGPGDPSEPADPPNPVDPTEPSEPADPGEGDKATVQLSYSATEGGTVSRDHDTISATTGDPLEGKLADVLATPLCGYHFVGWTVNYLNGDGSMGTDDSLGADQPTLISSAFSMDA